MTAERAKTGGVGNELGRMVEAMEDADYIVDLVGVEEDAPHGGVVRAITHKERSAGRIAYGLYFAPDQNEWWHSIEELEEGGRRLTAKGPAGAVIPEDRAEDWIEKECLANTEPCEELEAYLAERAKTDRR